MTKTATLEDRCRQYEDWLSKIVFADMLATATGEDDGVAVADTIGEVVEEAKAAGAGFDGFIRKAAGSLAKDILTRRYGEAAGLLAELDDRLV